MVSSETSMASVMVPDPVCLIRRPFAVIPEPEASNCTRSPVEEDVNNIPWPVPALVMSTTAPDAEE